MTTKTRATVEDLYAVPDNAKAELVNGELILLSPTGDKPGWAGDEIFASLRSRARMTSFGRAVSDNKGFLASLPHRKSFSPDAAFYTGRPCGMKYFPDVPVFAAEIRSENDYGPPAEQEMSQKRADYFAAGCRVVWDVDLLSADVVRVYRVDVPETPMIYRRGGFADAEPAVSGWKMAVDELFEQAYCLGRHTEENTSNGRDDKSALAGERCADRAAELGRALYCRLEGLVK